MRQLVSIPVLALACAVVRVAPARAQLAVGSQMPCAVPMAWTVARVDVRFDLSEEEATRALHDAAAMWERAVGRELFRVGGDDANPVSFDFDERQAEVEEGQAREQALESERLAIEARRDALNEEIRAHERTIQEYERDITEHDWAVRSYNNDMARLSRQREPSASDQRDMARRGEDIERSSRSLQERSRDLNRRAEEIRASSDRLNDWISAFNGRRDAHVGAYPEAPTQAGRYGESVSWLDGAVDSVDRRIRIFQYSSYEELVVTLAHELGHALGLGHAPEPGAVMSEMLTREAVAAPDEGVTAVDVRMLEARCPDVGRS